MIFEICSVDDLRDVPISFFRAVVKNDLIILCFREKQGLNQALFDKKFIRTVRALAYSVDYKKAIVLTESGLNSPVYLIAPFDSMEGQWPSEYDKKNFLCSLTETLRLIRLNQDLFCKELNLLTTESPEGYRCTKLIRDCLCQPVYSGLKVISPKCGNSPAVSLQA